MKKNKINYYYFKKNHNGESKKLPTISINNDDKSHIVIEQTFVIGNYEATLTERITLRGEMIISILEDIKSIWTHKKILWFIFNKEEKTRSYLWT